LEFRRGHPIVGNAAGAAWLPVLGQGASGVSLHTDFRQLLEAHAPTRHTARPVVEAACVFLGLLAVTFTTIYFIYVQALAAQQGEIRQGLLRIGSIVASQVDPELHKTFIHPDLEHSPAYIEAEARLMRIRFSDPTIAYIWTAIRRDGQVYFVLDPTPPPAPGQPDNRVALLEVYPDPPREMLEAFDVQASVTSSAPYTDQWGTFLSAYVPLRDSDGAFVALVGVDIDVSEYLRRLVPIKRATTRALVTAFFIAFLAASVVWFLRRFILELTARRMALYEEFKVALSQLEAGDDHGPAAGAASRADRPA